MKNFKFLIVVAVLFTTVAAALAFTPSPKAAVTNTFWFSYVGGPVDDQSSYVLSEVQPSCPTGTEHLCSIMAEGEEVNSQVRPVLTPSLVGRIEDAIANGQQEADIKLYQ